MVAHSMIIGKNIAPSLLFTCTDVYDHKALSQKEEDCTGAAGKKPTDVLSDKQTPRAELVTPIHELKNI